MSKSRHRRLLLNEHTASAGSPSLLRAGASLGEEWLPVLGGTWQIRAMGRVFLGNRKVLVGSNLLGQSCFLQPDNAFLQPDGGFLQPDGGFLQPNGVVMQPNGVFLYPQVGYRRTPFRLRI